MNSTVFVQGWRRGFHGALAVGILCGAAFAAPPEEEKPAASEVESAPAKSGKNPARSSRNSGGSLLGSVIQFFTGVSVESPSLMDDDDGEEIELVMDDDEAVEAIEIAVPVEIAEPWKLPDATHHQTQRVKIDKKGGNGLQTFCVTSTGELVAVVGPPRYGAQSNRGNTPLSELQLFDGDGNFLRKWTVDFGVQAVTSSPDGTILAAGNGQVAKFNSEGELVKQVELQHVKESLGDPEGMRKAAEELIEQQREQIESIFKDQKDQLQSRIEKLKSELEDLDEDDKKYKTKTRQLATTEKSLKQIERQQDQMGGRQKVDDVIRDLTARLKIVNAVTASQDDVFVACSVKNGYGFAVWRMTPDFEEPKQIITGLSGCCGQMDIQCQGSELYVAENSRHRVACYNRDGKQLRTFGGRLGQKNGQFGGCCNPMNLCFDKDGAVLTAESEGIVRKFTASGQSIGPVGGCKLSGGCKNVAIGISPDGDKVYFCDLPGSQIIVMARNTEEPNEDKETSDKTE